MALDVLAAAGITALGNYFGGLNAAGPEGSYVAPSDARFAYLNMQKFNPDSGAINALQQSKSRLAQMKAQRLGYIQQQYNQQRAAGGIGGHQLAGSLGLMGNQFAAMAEQELALDKAIADQMNLTNQQRLQKYAAQQQAILTPSKDGNQKFGTLGQKLTDAFNTEGEQGQWNSLEDVIQWINSNYGDPRGTNSGLGGDNENGGNGTNGNSDGGGGAPTTWSSLQGDPLFNQWIQTYINSIPDELRRLQAQNQFEHGSLQFLNNVDPSQFTQWKQTQPSGGNSGNDPFVALQQQYPELWSMYLQSNPNFSTGISSPSMTDFQSFINANNNGGSGNAGGDNGSPETPIMPGPPQLKYDDVIGPSPIVRPRDLMSPANSEGNPVVDPMVYPTYNKPKQKLNLPIDDNLLAMYKQGLLEM